MSGGHAHGSFLHRDSRVHALAPQCKVVATLLFAVVVVATPIERWTAWMGYGGVLIWWTSVAEVPASWVLRRLVFEAPFLLFALFLPLLGGGDHIDLFGLALSLEGSLAALNVVVKSTFVLTSVIVLVATTQTAAILHGFEHLRMPRVITAIAGFMVRYIDVILGEARRMAIARSSRAYDPRWLWQSRALAAGLGALFVRSFERGERVHRAMLSRGYSGAMPQVQHAPARSDDWLFASLLPVSAALIGALTWLR